MKPAASMRSSAMRFPSGPTTAVDTATPISFAFSSTASKNGLHSIARSLIMPCPLAPNCCFGFLVSILKTGSSDHACPFLGLTHDHSCESFRGATERIHALRTQQGPNVVGRKRIVNGVIELCDHLLGCACGGQQPKPDTRIESRESRFGHSRKVRCHA